VLKILIMVLGCGAIGSDTVEQLIRYSNFDIIAADLNFEKVKSLIQKFDSNRISAENIDINNHDDLIKKIKNANPDVIANTIGPFYLTASKVYNACIDAGVNCVDVCDDPPGTKAALDLHEKAKEAEITLITGAGDSPGLPNILARFGADRMEHVEEINIYWISPWSFAGKAQFLHALYMYVHSHQYINGELIKLRGKITSDFLSPFGKYEVSYCDHPEPYTIPLYIEGVKNVRNAGSIWPNPGFSLEDLASLTDLLQNPIEIQDFQLSKEEIISALLDNVRENLKKHWEKKKIPYDLGATRVEIIGKNDEMPVKYIFNGIGRGSTGTSRCLATIAKMLAKNHINKKGAFAPEGCIDPKLFIKKFSGGRLGFKLVPETSYINFIRVE
jgi:saccharopine dehydrogenase (NAD+, L-lysine-forming)